MFYGYAHQKPIKFHNGNILIKEICKNNRIYRHVYILKFNEISIELQNLDVLITSDYSYKFILLKDTVSLFTLLLQRNNVNFGEHF